MLKTTVIITLFVKLCLTWEYSVDVQRSYYPYPFTPARILGPDHNYIVKVILQKEILGVGVCLNQEWFVTCKFFGNNATKKLRIATWDSSRRDVDEGFQGEGRSVNQIIVHPYMYTLKTWNYDVVLLRVTDPIEFGFSLNMIDVNGVRKPKLGEKCLVAATFQDGNIYGKEVTIMSLDDCKDHKHYKYYKDCRYEKEMFCVNVSEPIYGAPVLCWDRLVGILPSNLDLQKNVALFQSVETYKDWINSNLGRTKAL